MNKKLKFKRKPVMINGVHYVAIPKAYFDNQMMSRAKHYWFTVDSEYKEEDK